MKKVFVLMASVCLALVSCHFADPDGENGPVVINPDDVLVDKNEVLDPYTQKVKLEQVGTKLMDLFSAEEYRDLVKAYSVLLSHCDKYIDNPDYDWSDLEELEEEKLASFYKEKKLSEYRWEYTYTLLFSNCTGVYVFDKDEVSYQKSDVTKVVLKDVNGEDWEAVVTPVNPKEVYLGEWTDYYYGYNEDGVYGENEDTYKFTVEIPESLSLEVTRAGEMFANVTVGLEHRISNKGLDYEKDRVGATVSANIDDLKIELQNASYDAQTGELAYTQSVYKGNKMLVSQSVSGKVLPDLEEDEDGDEDLEKIKGELVLDVNVLGEIQIKGTCTDLQKLMDVYVKEFESLEDCEAFAEKALEYVNCSVYYDCTSTVQATLGFEPCSGWNYEYNEETESYEQCYFYWLEPVIVFEDASRYFFEDYFWDGYFKDFFENFEEFLLKYDFIMSAIY